MGERPVGAAAGEPDPAVAAEVARQKALILRGMVDVITEPELEGKLRRSLETGTPLRVKLGVDPTADFLHLGFTVGLNKLRQFQELGHQAVLIIGDGTALVGDPTGRNKTRPRLTLEEVDRNARGYLEQAGKVLDMERVEVRRNHEWLKELDFIGMIGLAARTTLARMLERNDFSQRYQAGLPIHLHELLYPLLQGWDSVQVRADVELGGSDQLFNLLVGRDLQQQEGQEAQVCLTTPLLLGLDGQRKMSKSFGNAIGVSDPPESIFTSIMRIDDEMMPDYFRLATRLPDSEIDALLATDRNPRDTKEILGRTLVEMYHGREAAEAAAAHFRRVVSERRLPEDLATVTPPAGDRRDDGTWSIIDLVCAAGFAKSRSEARRLVTQGGVSIDDEKVTDIEAAVAVEGGEILRVGRKRVCRLAT